MKIYSKVGDCGFTELLSGEKVSKAAPIVEIFGFLDELNAYLGFVIPVLENSPSTTNISPSIQKIQQDLLDLGGKFSLLSINQSVVELGEWLKKRIESLETEIDQYSNKSSTLKTFVVMGKNEASSRLHLARVVCRRIEREILKIVLPLEKDLLHPIKFPTEFFAYLNRLSDWLYVMAVAMG